MQQQNKHVRLVAAWIFLGLIMLIGQVLLGGITRLTGSGLSITEWKPIVGALPPMTDQNWVTAFGKYQQIAQYKYLNQHFTLSNFKFIFFWEWLHRLWARLIGLVFIFPFCCFIIKRFFEKWMVTPLVLLFLLGALQGAVGWIMVRSGLNESDVYVSHFRLAIHFMAAMLLICYTLIFGLKLTINPASFVPNSTLYKYTIVLIILVSIQLIFGAFMAGLKAASAAPTWPLINGEIIPLTFKENLFHHPFTNKIVVHFIHRVLAYIIGIAIFFWWYKARHYKLSNAFSKSVSITVSLVCVQILLGILTVLNSPKIVPGQFGTFEMLALLHQLTGMLLLLSLVANAFLTFTKTGNRNVIISIPADKA